MRAIILAAVMAVCATAQAEAQNRLTGYCPELRIALAMSEPTLSITTRTQILKDALRNPKFTLILRMQRNRPFSKAEITHALDECRRFNR